MADSVSPGLWDGVAVLINAAADPPAFLGSPRFHLGEAPPNAPLGYVLFGQVGDLEAGYLNGQAGQAVRPRFHCWTPKPHQALALARWLKRVLHGVVIAVEGYEPVTLLYAGQSGPTADAGGRAWQVMQDYATEAMEAAA